MRPYSTRLLAVAGLVLLSAGAPTRADDWPQWLGPQRDGVWRESGVVDSIPAGGPKVAWRVPVGGGYAGPAVAGGKVYVTDRVLAAGAKNPSNAFARDAVAGKERVVCLDAVSGKPVWEYEYPCTYTISYAGGPRCTPVVAEGKLWTLGAMGDLVCLDATSGKHLWSKNLPKEYEASIPMWGYAAHPLLDGNKLICLVGGKGSVAVAFDKDTGKEIWRALSMAREPSPPKWEIGYCPPVIFQVGKTRQLIIWHSEAANGLDPETGKAYWSVPIESGASMTIPTPRLDGDKLFLTSFYGGSTLIRLDPQNPTSASIVWQSKLTRSGPEMPKNTTKLHCVMSTPYIKDGYIYGVCSFGQLRCLRLEDGERVWEDLRATGSAKEPVERWANAFLVPHGDRVFMPNEKGDLVIARLSPKGYDEIGRVHLLEPTGKALGRNIVWSHPAFANRCMYARNDKELICVSLAAE
jgi:outer membrane protein assembly factor BamB